MKPNKSKLNHSSSFGCIVKKKKKAQYTSLSHSASDTSQMVSFRRNLNLNQQKKKLKYSIYLNSRFLTNFNLLTNMFMKNFEKNKFSFKNYYCSNFYKNFSANSDSYESRDQKSYMKHFKGFFNRKKNRSESKNRFNMSSSISFNTTDMSLISFEEQEEEKKRSDRKKDLKIFIHRFLGVDYF